MKDLVILVADKDMEFTMKGLLGRPQALNIRPVDYDLFVHFRHDPGCCNEAHSFLRQFSRRYQYALVMFDYEGCGQEQIASDDLANRVKQRLEQNGWLERVEVAVLVPELEVWVWSSSPQVAACLGWAGHQPALRDWLTTNSHWPLDRSKPPQPKTALEAALREVHEPRSSAIYLELATKVSLRGHIEPTFLHFTQTLQKWFPSPSNLA